VAIINDRYSLCSSRTPFSLNCIITWKSHYTIEDLGGKINSDFELLSIFNLIRTSFRLEKIQSSNELKLAATTMNSRLDRASLVRHCAFCLTEITGEAIKTCGKCHKRAYCSKACQRVDWSPNKKQKGQGHRTWCGTDYGEEDLNWKVSPVSGKGLGIIALQDIPKAYPILVEAPVDKTLPSYRRLTAPWGNN